MDPNVAALNAVTLYEIYPRTLQDEYFLAAPLLAYWRDHCLVPFTGGAFMQAPFRYAPLIGGFYAPGANFNINKRTTIAALQFDARYVYVSIPEYLEEVEVKNKGPLAVASILESDMQNGVDTLNEIVAIASNQNGQLSGRTTSINGWPEAINDGLTPSYDGNVYANYGGQPRNGVVSDTLNSVPVWVGDSAGNAGVINYPVLEEGYQDACRGKKEPNLGVGNKAVIAYVKEKLVVQQRFQQERDPVWGVMGFRFNNAMILKDDYFPSLKYGKANRAGGQSSLTSTFVVPAAAAAASNLPVAGTTVTVGEVFCFFNTFDFLFRVSDSEQFGGGFSGFVPAQNNTKVVGQIKMMCNVENIAPWSSKQFYGIGG